MNKLQPCSAAFGKPGLCRNGFIETAVCSGISAESVIPFCCREEACGRLYAGHGGKPPESMMRLETQKEQT